MRDVRLYFEDIRQACVCILEFTADLSLEQFRKDIKTKSAVERQFEIIGEAARQLPSELPIQHPHIPWRQI
jgi:uncharacterized protein with HEPN domain